MNFGEKLRLLGQTINKAKVSREAGMKPNALSTYIATGSIPRADIALRLARALSVPVEWLIDDARDWPPPPNVGSSAIAEATSGVLLTELARRYRLDLLEAIAHADEAEKTDWAEVWQELQKLRPDQLPGGTLVPKLRILSALVGSYTAINLKYDARVAADLIHDKLPGRDRPIERTSFQYFAERFARLIQRPGLAEASAAMTWPNVAKVLSGFVGLTFGNLLDVMDPDRRLKLIRETVPALNNASSDGIAPKSHPTFVGGTFNSANTQIDRTITGVRASVSKITDLPKKASKSKPRK